MSVAKLLFAAAFTAGMSIPALAYEESPVAGGGALEGTVVFRDTVPTRKIIPTKDVEVCGGARE